MSHTEHPDHPAAARRGGAARQKVPPFARYEGTSAWKKDRKRVREYARFRAATRQLSQDANTASV